MISISARQSEYYRGAHRLMLSLAALHFLICFGVAVVTHTWTLLLFLGVPALLIPAWVAHKYPDELISRLVMATGFMTLTGLLIQQTEGNAEAYFSFFVMSSALVVYCDTRPLVLAAACILLHHVILLGLQATGLDLTEQQGRTWWHVLAVLVQTGVMCPLAQYLRQLVFDSYKASAAVTRIAEGDLQTQLDPAETAQSEMLAAVAVMQNRLRDTLHDLQLARKQAEDLTLAKGMFLANMGHEFRTPMNAIIGLSHLALQNEAVPRQQDYLNKILSSSQHLLSVFNNMLDFSNADMGHLSVESIAFEMDTVLQNVAIASAEKAAHKGLELICDVDPAIPQTLIGDPLRLGQILSNFADNAIKFTTQGSVTISVSMNAELSDIASRVLLRFEVRDTGPGVSEDKLEKLFQNFSPEANQSTSPYGSDGLGLAISKKLVELMSGKIGADSELGQGSVFWFSVSLGVAEAPIYELTPNVDLRGRKALVVDDSVHTASLLATMLETLGFVVEIASSGAEAIAKISEAARQSDDFDVVLLDWQMPEMDGVETAKAIIELGLFKSPQKVMVAGKGSADILKTAALYGVHDVLIRPVSSSQLYSTMMHVVGNLCEPEFAMPLSKATLPEYLEALRGRRILLVEDNDLNQQVAMELLNIAGFEVDLAENGAIAVEKVNKFTYDLVLMDMQMPVLNGINATEQIRENPAHARLPILAMTANVMQEDRDHCFAAGMNGFVAKPIDPDALWEALVQWIRPRKKTHATSVAELQAIYAPPILVEMNPPVIKALVADGEFPEKITGIDIPYGLSHMMGKRDVYLHVLKKFLTTQEHTVREVQAYFDAGSYAEAERAVYGLKTIAASLGAHALNDAATLLEAALRQRQPADAVHPLIFTTGQYLDEIIYALKAAFPEEAALDQQLLV